MPELFRRYGFVFYFYSLEHAPIHVHVKGSEGYAKFSWDGEHFAVEYCFGIKTNDLKRIEKTIDENSDIIVKRWKEIFKIYDEDSENMV